MRRLTAKFREYFIPSAPIDLGDKNLLASLGDMDARADKLRASMHRAFRHGDISSSPWDLTAPSAAVGTQNYGLTDHYRNLLVMSQALLIPESRHYRNPDMYSDIVNAMEWLLNNAFRGNVRHADGKDVMFKYYGFNHRHVSETGVDHSANWWHYDIGMPLFSAQILSLLSETEFPKDLTDEYLKRIHIYSPNSTARVFVGADEGVLNNYGAANMADKCCIIMIQGLLASDEGRVRQAASELLTDLTIPFSAEPGGAGYHSDGSYIEHGIYPYALGYGIAALTSISEVMGVLGGESINGAPIVFNESKLQTLFDMIVPAWLTTMWKGAAMPNLMGRGISRRGAAEALSARVAHTLYNLLGILPKDIGSAVKSAIKSWLIHSPKLLRSPSLAMNIKLAAAADSGIAPKEPIGIFAQNKQCRVHWRTENFALSIALNNEYIGPYASINGENLKGAFTGEGMSYLFPENDYNQFGGDFFASVDYEKLPGITMEQGTEFIISAEDSGAESISAENTKINPRHTFSKSRVFTDKHGKQFGAAGFHMDMNGRFGMDITANKSWFFIGDIIVALGSNINSRTGREAVTVVENRRLPASGHVITREKGAIHLSYPGLRGSIAQAGFFIPDAKPNAKQKVTAEIVSSTGRWSDTNVNGSADEITEQYARIILSHGANPADGTYEYVILPNASEEKLYSFAKSQAGAKPIYEAVRIEPNLHMLYSHKFGIMFTVNFADGTISIKEC